MSENTVVAILILCCFGSCMTCQIGNVYEKTRKPPTCSEEGKK